MQFAVWPLRKLGEAVGISPNLRISFGCPVNAGEVDVSFIQLPVIVDRQRWWGATKAIDHCGIRLRVRTEGWPDDERPGVWFDDSGRDYCSKHITLFEGGYSRFDIPLVVQHVRDSYWHDDARRGTYLADMVFMYPHRLGGMKLNPALYRIGVDIIAGPKILATSEWIVNVTSAPSVSIERAFSEVGWNESIWFRLQERATEPSESQEA